LGIAVDVAQDLAMRLECRRRRVRLAFGDLLKQGVRDVNIDVVGWRIRDVVNLAVCGAAIESGFHPSDATRRIGVGPKASASTPLTSNSWACADALRSAHRTLAVTGRRNEGRKPGVQNRGDA
jgi:hypothetical protein